LCLAEEDIFVVLLQAERFEYKEYEKEVRVDRAKTDTPTMSNCFKMFSIGKTAESAIYQAP